jgi:hypothetical protein
MAYFTAAGSVSPNARVLHTKVLMYIGLIEKRSCDRDHVDTVISFQNKRSLLYESHYNQTLPIRERCRIID